MERKKQWFISLSSRLKLEKFIAWLLLFNQPNDPICIQGKVIIRPGTFGVNAWLSTSGLLYNLILMHRQLRGLGIQDSFVNQKVGYRVNPKMRENQVKYHFEKFRPLRHPVKNPSAIDQ